MSALVLVAVLCSAALHATWNAIAKAIPDRLVASTLIGAAFAVLGLLGCVVAPVPRAGAWPYLVASALVQTAYLLLLTAAYRGAQFGTTYPVARGLAVVLVTIFSVAVLGERLSPVQVAGVAVVVAGLAGLAVQRGTPSRTLALAGAVGMTVATYTLLDGVGVRSAGSVLGYASWLFLLHGLATVATCAVLARRRDGYRQGLRTHARLGLLGGLLSVVAYGIVVWAQSQAPLALVAAIRETGVVMAGILGVVVFGERATVRRAIATVAACAGIVAIRLGA